MQLVCKDFNELLTTVTDAANVYASTGIKNADSYIVLKIEKGGKAFVVGASPSITYRKMLTSANNTVKIEATDVFDNNGALYLQMKASDLMNFLGVYRALSVTEVYSTTFDTLEGDRIRCTICERSLAKPVHKDIEVSDSDNTETTETEDEDVNDSDAEDNSVEEDETTESETTATPVKEVEEEPRYMYSSWLFKNTRVSASLMDHSNINIVNQPVDECSFADLSYYFKNVVPILEKGNGYYSVMNFKDDWIFAFSKKFAVFIRNNLSGANKVLADIQLVQAHAAFLNKVTFAKKADNVKISKNNEYILFDDNAGSETFVKYDTALPEITKYFKIFSDVNDLSFSKPYFKDALRRLSLRADESINFNLDSKTSEFTLKNSAFEQKLPIKINKGYDGEDSNYTFAVVPESMASSIMYANVDDSLHMCLSHMEGGTKAIIMTLSDDSHDWFSLLRITNLA